MSNAANYHLNSEDGLGELGPPWVLELRVHGVNNTTPAALVDLPSYDLRQVSGDNRASFWLAQPDIRPRQAERGHIPPGIRREAYSWGGLVRDDPGSQKWTRAITLAFQVLALPLSLGNATMWTRELTTDADRRARRLRAAITAGATRLFGLVLTLLFTTTAVTLAVDLAGLQCVNGSRCTGPWQGVWGWVENAVPAALLTPDRVLAGFTLVAVLAVGLLAWFAGLARRRYDTLHKKRGSVGDAVRAAIEESKETKRPSAAAQKGRAVLGQTAFWSNRVTGRLGLVHLAGAIALVVFQVALHVAIRSGEASNALETAFRVLTVFATATIIAAVVAVMILPTQTITPRGTSGGQWTAVLSWVVLGVAVGQLAVLFLVLWFADADVATSPSGLLAADWPPLVLVAGGVVLAVWGIFWRSKGARPGTAWKGCGPAVFMSASLSFSLLVGAATVALASVVAAGIDGPGLLGLGRDSSRGLGVPAVFLAVGSLLAWAVGLLLLLLASFSLPQKVLTYRVNTMDPRPLDPLPSDSEKVVNRVERLRRRAATIHLIEPAAATIAIILGTAVVLGVVWAGLAAVLREPLANVSPAASGFVAQFLAWSIAALTVLGLLLAVTVAVFGIIVPKPGIVAIVWDITCFLPRTAQPFGPPCYAERAVPDVAQRLCDWLGESPDRRAVLAAHSMGAMVAVAALGLLGATSPQLLPRVSLLTFGVQLRVFFGRFLPGLVGPRVLHTFPAQAPRPWRRDPWMADVTADKRVWDPPPERGGFGRLQGDLLPPPGVRWINLWRLTDYLGFPAVAGFRSLQHGSARWDNRVDVYAREVDRTVEPPLVVAHNDYIRVETYETQLLELANVSNVSRGPGERRRQRLFSFHSLRFRA